MGYGLQQHTGGTRGRTISVVILLVVALLGLNVHQARPARAATAGKIAPAIAALGTGLAITGDALGETAGVTFLGGEGDLDDVAAPHFVVVDAKKVVVQVPPGARTGPVALSSPTGTVVSAVPATIAQPPAITGLSSPSLAPGATLTINGNDLLGVKKTTVLFDQKKATALPTSTASGLQVVVPAGVPGGPVTISVATEGGTAYEDFIMAPAIKSVMPPAGTTAGGTTITILGSGFTGVDGFANDPATPDVDESLAGVTIGGKPVSKIIAVSDAEIVAVTPSSTPGPAHVVVSTTSGPDTAASTTPINFSYQPLPVVRSMSADWNPVSTAGEPRPVTATGVNLTAATRVLVGTVPATDLVEDPQAGTLTFTPPVGLKAALSKVTFINTVGAASYPTTVPFSYIAAPTVAKLTPATGPAASVVSIAGTGFGSGTTATFGAKAADCAVVTPALLRCVAPAGEGAADVVVSNGVGQSLVAPATVFTYTTGTPAPAPVTVAAPTTLTGITPVYGTPGSTVALKGANLHLVNKVEFPGAEAAWVDAPRFITVSPTRVVVTVPAGVASGALRVTTPAGRVTSGYVNFVASVRPVVNSINVVGDATYGVAAGDMVEIKGAGLMVGSIRPVVTIGGKPAALLSRPVPTAKTILVRVPAGVGGRERVAVTTPLGSATAEASVYFTPQVKAVKPLSYSRAGGQPVTITGSGFTGVDRIEDAAGGRLSGVTFGGVPVARLVVMSDKELVVTTAVGSASVDMQLVRTQHGSWIGSSDEQVRATNLPVPTITGVTPGVAVLGVAPTPVTISGTNLRDSSSVRFGAVPGEVQSASEDGTSLVVVPPARSTTARVDITVTNVVLGEELAATLAGAFRYLPQPKVSGLTPATGFTGVTPPAVTLTGANLRSSTVVRFGEATATVDSVSDNGTTMVVTPPRTDVAGAVDVTATNIVDDDALTATVAGGYTYVLRAFPTVTAISPNSAVAGAATSPVTISGSNLLANSVVRFGNVDATVESAAPDGSSLVVVPPVGPAGAVSVTITNTIAGDQLSVTEPGAFRYLPTPSVSSVSPASGTVGMAQPPVTITGTNLLANSVVRFGSVTGAIQSVTSDGTKLVVSPPVLETPGPVDVTVTNIVDGEQLTDALASGYTYLSSQSPTITDVSPATGTTSLSNPNVTITGSKLRADTIVKFGSATATVVSVGADGNSLVVTPPVAASDGFVAVTVTNVVDGQHLSSALASAYRYLPHPAVSSVSPNTGLTGTTPPAVTITGTNLRLNSVVRFGTATATISSAAADGTSIVVTPPARNTVAVVDVTVTNIVDGTQQLTATRTNGYEYALAAARITGMSAGTALPGTQVTLTGTSFAGVTSVRFGSVSATFSVASATTIYATVPVTPANAHGSTADVTVLNGTGEISTADPVTADDWTWAANPFITGMTPKTGGQGSEVTITGTGFTGAAAVRFGNIDVAYTVDSDTTIRATVPATPAAGSVAEVTVLARDLTSPEPLVATINDWTWHPIAVITKMNPNPGSAGATITVTGRNFTNIRSVTVNGVDVTNTVVVTDSTTLTFVAPARPTGGGTNRTDKPVYITNASGVLSTSETDPATGKPAHLFTWL